MATYGIETHKADGNKVDVVVKAATNRAAAEWVQAEYDLYRLGCYVAVDAPGGSRTFYSVQPDGKLVATDRRNASGQWVQL